MKITKNNWLLMIYSMGMMILGVEDDEENDEEEKGRR